MVKGDVNVVHFPKDSKILMTYSFLVIKSSGEFYVLIYWNDVCCCIFNGLLQIFPLEILQSNISTRTIKYLLIKHLSWGKIFQMEHFN